LPTEQEFGLLAKTTGENAKAVQDWQNHLNKLQDELSPLQAELSQATDPRDIERLTKRIGELQIEMAKTPDNIPPILSGFQQWRERIAGLAADYAALPANMQTIMDALVAQHVTGTAEIMAVVREQGPAVAADFAQWCRDDPFAAETTVKDIMPGIIG